MTLYVSSTVGMTIELCSLSLADRHDYFIQVHQLAEVSNQFSLLCFSLYSCAPEPTGAAPAAPLTRAMAAVSLARRELEVLPLEAAFSRRMRPAFDRDGNPLLSGRVAEMVFAELPLAAIW